MLLKSCAIPLLLVDQILGLPHESPTNDEEQKSDKRQQLGEDNRGFDELHGPDSGCISARLPLAGGNERVEGGSYLVEQGLAGKHALPANLSAHNWQGEFVVPARESGHYRANPFPLSEIRSRERCQRIQFMRELRSRYGLATTAHRC